MTKNAKATIWATVAVTMLIVGVVTYERQKPKRPIANKVASETKTATTVPDQIQIVAPAEITTSSPPAVATSTPVIIRKRKPAPTALFYGDAVAKYTNTRIQFTPGCLQAIPSQMAVANPVTIMLDNRSDTAQTIIIAGKSYLVSAYNYTLVTLNQKILPAHLFIKCNQQFNVAEIILQ